MHPFFNYDRILAEGSGDMMIKSTEQLALTHWDSWETNAVGQWTHDTINTACLAYLAQQARIQTARLRDIDNSMCNIKHYFHTLDTDGFRQLIRMKASTMRRQRNKKIIEAVACHECDAQKGRACQSPDGYRKPHTKRVTAYEAGA